MGITHLHGADSRMLRNDGFSNSDLAVAVVKGPFDFAGRLIEYDFGVSFWVEIAHV